MTDNVKEKLDALPKFDFDTYATRPEMNSSILRRGLKSMKSLHNSLNQPDKRTKALTFGNQYHEMILEPEEFEEKYVVMPNFAAMPENKTKTGAQSTSWASIFAKDNKKFFEEEAALNGQEVIAREQYDKGLRICEAVHDNYVFQQLAKDCVREVTLFGELEGVPCKSRLDLAGDPGIIDIKGTRSCAPKQFGRSFCDLSYGFQMAFYREMYYQNVGFRPPVYIIAVETDDDFDCCAYEVPDQLLDDNLTRVKLALRDYKTAKAYNRWPGVDRGAKGALPLWVPNWAMSEDETDDGLIWEEEASV